MEQPNLIPVSLDGVELYQLWSDYPYFVHGDKEVIREGYILDGASVPRLLWPLLPRDGTHRAAALKHDWGYDGRGQLENGLNLTKDEVDDIFYVDILHGTNLGAVKSYLIWLAVHKFGQHAWDEGDGRRLILPIGSLAPTYGPRKRKIFRHLYE